MKNKFEMSITISGYGFLKRVTRHTYLVYRVKKLVELDKQMPRTEEIEKEIYLLANQVMDYIIRIGDDGLGENLGAFLDSLNSRYKMNGGRRLCGNKVPAMNDPKYQK